MKSLLSSFSDDFNAKIDVYRFIEKKSETWFVKNDFEKKYTWISCLLLRDNWNPYNNFITNMWSYIKTTHKIRLEKGFEILEKDKVIDQNWIEYEVKFVEETPGFAWNNDHLLLLIDRTKNV